MARGRGRGRGRPPKSTRTSRSSASNNEAADDAIDDAIDDVTMEDATVDETGDNLAEASTEKNDVSAANDNDAAGTNADEEVVEVRTPARRGRKRKVDKVDIPPEEKEDEEEDDAPTEPVKRGSLRRRDTLKSTSRYSPPPVTTRVRGTNRLFPSTSQSKYVIDADAEDITSMPIKSESPTPIPITTNNRRKSLGVRNVTVSAVDTTVEAAKADDNSQTLVVTLPDGSQKEVSYKKTTDHDESTGAEEPKPDSSDPEYKPAVRSLRRKSDNASTTATTTSAAVAIVPEKSAASTPVTETRTPKVSNNTTVKLTSHVGSTPIVAKTTTAGAVSSVTQLVKSTAPAYKTSLPAILKAASSANQLPSAALIKTAAPTPRRMPQQLTKYMDVLPELADCITNDGIDVSSMEKMPDKILLIQSELPLAFSESIDNSDKDYLFRQIISPVQTTKYICLLCKGIDVNFGTKEERDIRLHYESLHELEVETGHAKFSDDTVFICLPKMVLAQIDSPSGPLVLNSACQYCEAKLSDINEMRAHYAKEHDKQVNLMEQEQIMKMHHSFYCSKCSFKSEDFESHHKHMKTEHSLKSFRCKSCVLVTQDEMRLRSHYKAKHMLHSSGQNYQCFYCHGLLIGVDRLLKHIQQSHMVQTGTEFSCIACLQTCGRGKELLNHAQDCNLAGTKPVQTENRSVPIVPDPSPLQEGEVECYICSIRLESEAVYQLHLHHEHMKWVGDPKNQGTGTQPEEDVKLLTIDDVISDEDLQKAKIETFVGHWCRMCDQMIKVYQLFYLHMVNYHRLTKEFQCVITNCKAQFVDFEEFRAHIEENGHSQKTITTHPDEVSVCTYCDIYFASEEELVNHLITDQHINKFTASGHFHRTEPRNFKCKACHTFFGMKESYIHHLETESHKYNCTYCGITTATSSARRAHVQNTHPDKLLACEECHEVHQDIMGHFVVHGFSFECKKCVKKFYNRERLNAHMEVHQDPIECTWRPNENEKPCARNIATRSMLVTHYRGHKSEHKCQECGQAFWNFAMLTSHQRSHQPLPRSVNSNVGNARNSFAGRNQSFSPLNRGHNTAQRQRQFNTPSLASNFIKCGHCEGLFKTTNQLQAHACQGKGVHKGVTPNGSQNKLYDLASKASTAPKAVNRQPARRKPSPKKPVAAAPSNDQQFNAVVMDDSAQGDDDTQLIMILNQVTGELMEITAPKGMEVKDVIDSLNFQNLDESNQTVQVVDESLAEHGIAVQEEHPGVEQDEAAQAIEIIEQQQVNEEEAASGSMMITDDSQAAGQSSQHEDDDPVPEVVDPSELENHQVMEGKVDGPQISTQVIEGEDGQHEQAIVLPADCFNEDGSLTLDAETLQRLQLSVDDNGQIISDGNTTFIIDTSNNEQ